MSANLTHTALALSSEIVKTRNVVARGCSEVNLEYFTAVKARGKVSKINRIFDPELCLRSIISLSGDGDGDGDEDRDGDMDDGT